MIVGEKSVALLEDGIDFLNRIRKMSSFKRKFFISLFISAQLALVSKMSLFPLILNGLLAITLIFINKAVYPFLKYAYKPRVPLIVLDDINTIFESEDMNKRYFGFLKNQLYRMDTKTCNTIFLCSDTLCHKEIDTIPGNSERIIVFNFKELTRDSFKEGIEQEVVFKYYSSKNSFEKFIRFPLSKVLFI